MSLESPKPRLQFCNLEFPSLASRACFRTQSPPFRHGYAPTASSSRNGTVPLRDGPPSVSLKRRASAERGGDTVGSGVEEGRRGMAGCFAPSLPSSLCFSFCLSHLCYCQALAYSPLLPFSCLVPLTLICQSCPAVPCHPRPLGGGRKKREECERVGRPPGDCARGPAEHCKATLWLFLLSFFLLPSFTLFAIVV